MESQKLNPADRAALVQRAKIDPVFHVEHIQGVTTLEDYQKSICRIIAQNSRVAIRACHSVGKTFILAKIVLWFLSTFERSKVVTTAPTWQQVELLLWSEIRAGFAASRYPLGGRMLNTEWKLGPDWFAVGLSPRDDADSSGGGQGKTSGFQGFHSENILVLFDEAMGVPPKRWIQASGMLTSANAKMVAIANPTSKASDFANCFKSRGWRKVHISCFDSPNLKANGINNIFDIEKELQTVLEMQEEQAQQRMESYQIVQPSLITFQWVMDRALFWGIHHPLFQSKVLGDFPEESENALFTISMIEEAQRRTYQPTEKDVYSLGVDVARYGSDKTVITPIHGDKVLPPKVMVKRDTMEVCGAVLSALREALATVHPKNTRIVVDATGLGSGVLDRLRELQSSGDIPSDTVLIEAHFGQTFSHVNDQSERDKLSRTYVNLKAQIFVELSVALKTRLCLPTIGAYAEELPMLIYSLDSKGRYVLESKDSFVERTGLGSPDHSDSLALAHYGLKQSGGEVGVIRVVKR